MSQMFREISAGTAVPAPARRKWPISRVDPRGRPLAAFAVPHACSAANLLTPAPISPVSPPPHPTRSARRPFVYRAPYYSSTFSLARAAFAPYDRCI
jgi:hypothetical protein